MTRLWCRETAGLRPRPAGIEHGVSLALLTSAFLAFASTSALAQVTQSPSQRPYRGLFGGGNSAPSGPNTLSLSGSVGVGYDDNVLARSTAPTTGPYESGVLAYASAGLFYDRTLEWGHFSSDVSSGLRYYPDLDRSSAPYFRAAAGLSFSPGRRNMVSLGQSVAYYSRYRLAYLPDEAISDIVAPTGTSTNGFAIDDDVGLYDRDTFTFASFGSYSRRLTSRSDISLSARFRAVDYSGEADDLSYWSGGGRYNYSLTRYLRAYAGYYYRPSRYGDDRENDYTSHNILAGVDFNRAYSIGGRRTALTFGVGSAMVSKENLTTGRTQYRATVVGNASLVHLFGRSWRGSVDYRRGLTYIPSLDEPYFSDTVIAGLNGLLTTRLEFYANAGYSTGKPSLSGGDRNYDTYFASSGLRYGLSRSLALSANYFYYHYRFDQGIDLPPGTARQLDRQGVRVGLDVWVPLIP